MNYSRNLPLTFCFKGLLIHKKKVPLKCFGRLEKCKVHSNTFYKNTNSRTTVAALKYTYNSSCDSSTEPFNASILSPAFRRSHFTVIITRRPICVNSIVWNNEKGTSKNSSQVEATVKNLMEKASSGGTNELPKPAVEKKSLWIKIKEEVLHYYNGFKLLFIDIKICSKYAYRLLNGEVLSRRERMQMIRTTSDLFRLLPFSVFIIIPFMEFLLPVALKLFPGMLPSTFETSNEKEAKMKKTLKVKLEMAKFLQQTLDSMSIQGKGHHSDSAKAFVLFFEKIQTTGEAIDNKEILKFSKLFEDEITLDSLTRPQLTALCKLLEMQPFGTNNFLRFQLRMKLRNLAADDKIIDSEGLDTLAVWELQQASRARGMRAYGLSKERLRLQLGQWLDLSLNEKVPPSLLLLSRTLYLPEKLQPEQSLAATISTLPEEVATRTKASIGKKEGKIDNLTRLEIIKSEEKKIEEDKKEQEEEDRKKLEEKLLKEKSAADEEELILEKSPFTSIDAATNPDVLEEQKHPIDEEVTAKDIDAVEEALEMMEIEKKSAFMEKQELLELKSELADYEEDIQDFKLALKQSGEDEKNLHESKAARRLFSKVNKMITKIDPIVEALNIEKESLQQKKHSENMADSVEADLINLEELTHHLKHLVDSTNVSKVAKIQSVLSKMDDDLDGAVKAEHVLKVLQLLSEQEEMSTKLFEEVVDLMVKEDQMEANTIVKKALELPYIKKSISSSQKAQVRDS